MLSKTTAFANKWTACPKSEADLTKKSFFSTATRRDTDLETQGPPSNSQKVPKLRAKHRIGPHDPGPLSVLFGSLLGDCHMERRSNKKSVRFSIQQENSNVEYLMWLHKYLASRGYCSPQKPKLYTRIGKHGKIRFYYRLNTYSFANLNWFYELFYGPLASPMEETSLSEGGAKQKPKAIPADKALETFLTPLALAVWFMDDGGKVSAGAKFATNCFRFEDLQRVRAVLWKKYQLECTIHSAGYENQYTLYIKKKSMPLFSKIVKKHMVQSMHYKLNGF
uniref:LAGLIDADG homing endonuclease n=1 Tax=Marophrys sp. SRT127 TaxID=2488311 RepID=A0A455REL0_9EUKA|nr:LAGLIDADG homing endonuclease [Marophrys sp. SRT127]BBH42972.1 LAGLIDADG homing endonuclease [Marophrys sp. SRT127]